MTEKLADAWWVEQAEGSSPSQTCLLQAPKVLTLYSSTVLRASLNEPGRCELSVPGHWLTLSYRHVKTSLPLATPTPCILTYCQEHDPAPHLFEPVFHPVSPFQGLSPKPWALQGLGIPSLLVLVLERRGPPLDGCPAPGRLQAPLGLGFLIQSQPLQ